LLLLFWSECGFAQGDHKLVERTGEPKRHVVILADGRTRVFADIEGLIGGDAEGDGSRDLAVSDFLAVPFDDIQFTNTYAYRVLTGVYSYTTTTNNPSARARRPVSSPMPALPPITTTVWPRSCGSRWMGEGALEVLMSPPIGILRLRIYPIPAHIDFGFSRRLTRTVDCLAAQQEQRRRIFRAGLSVKDRETIDLCRAIENWVFHGTFLSVGFVAMIIVDFE
jgi:hypothetical protein